MRKTPKRAVSALGKRFYAYTIYNEECSPINHDLIHNKKIIQTSVLDALTISPELMFIDYTLARMFVKQIACEVHHIYHLIITARVHVRTRITHLKPTCQ